MCGSGGKFGGQQGDGDNGDRGSKPCILRKMPPLAHTPTPLFHTHTHTHAHTPLTQVSMKPLFGGLTKGPTGVFKSVLDTNRTDGKRGRDEIYVDVVERLSITFNAAGNLVSSQIDGAIQVGCVCV